MIGNILVTLALIMSIYSMVMYFYAYRGSKNTVALARTSYHAMVMTIILASTYLLYLILTHQYQYKYVYEYSSNDLPIGYLISTFWAGQEGSFLLWLILTAVFGVFLQSFTQKRGELEFSVMAVYTLSTTFLLIMICPLFKNPFAMIWSEPINMVRAHINPDLLKSDYIQSAITAAVNAGHDPTYRDVYPALQTINVPMSEFVVNGRGLNALLQNFWMQIHPPILFAGFALTSVPFAFAISSLMRNEYRSWVKQSFPWMLAAGGVLGLGIMLGGYWAYGVLGWGGYWAWDPVENSSLVPWLVTVAAIHTFLVQRKTQIGTDGLGRFTQTNLILSVLVYVLVIYSTFLTRSGILGNASVHSFGEQGREVFIFLLIFILSFLGLGVGMIAYRWKDTSAKFIKDEPTYSRELALFTAAIALCASAFIVSFGTSLAMVDKSVTASQYNELHVPLAILIGLLNAFSIVIKWGSSTPKEVLSKALLSLIISSVMTILAIFWGGIHNVMMIIFFFSSSFALVINTEIAFQVFKGNPKLTGSYIAHIGIALFLLGVIGSAAYSVEQNVDLEKGVPTKVFGYDLTYKGYKTDKANPSKAIFKIIVKNGSTENLITPMMISDAMGGGGMREPDILVGFTKDLYISPQGLVEQKGSESSNEKSVKLATGEESALFNSAIKYSKYLPPDMDAMSNGGDFSMGAKISVTRDGKTYEKYLSIKKAGSGTVNLPVEIPELNLVLQILNLDPASKAITLNVVDISQTLSVTASIKPFISLVWLGVAEMFIGFVISMIRRLKESMQAAK